jgi:putative flippase GtrA
MGNKKLLNNLVSISKPLFFKFLKFSIVGFSGMIVDFGITYFCKERIRINKYVSNSVGFTMAASWNYAFNRVWTFRSNDPAYIIQYSKFLAIAIIGLLISNGIVYILNEKRNLNFYLAKLVAIFIVVIWNFLANYRFTF